MGILNNIAQLMSSADAQVSMTLSSVGNGRLKLIVKPLTGEVDEKADPSIKQLKAALNFPLKIVGAADEIESALIERIGNVMPARSEWERQLSQVQANLASASKTPAKKEKPAAPKEVVENRNESSEKPALSDEDDFDI